jgi:hypothetical protein
VLPPSSLLRKRRKERLAPCFLPSGIGTHAMTTSNAAEVSHTMFAACRGEMSFFRSLKLCVDLIEIRSRSLREDYLEAVAHGLGKQRIEVSMTTTPARSAIPPFLRNVFNKQEDAAKALLEPMKTDSPSADMAQYLFPVPAGQNGNPWVADPTAIPKGKYDEACSCGRTATEHLFCKHIHRVLTCTHSDWTVFVKPWQTVRYVVACSRLPSFHFAHTLTSTTLGLSYFTLHHPCCRWRHGGSSWEPSGLHPAPSAHTPKRLPLTSLGS